MVSASYEPGIVGARSPESARAAEPMEQLDRMQAEFSENGFTIIRDFLPQAGVLAMLADIRAVVAHCADAAGIDHDAGDSLDALYLRVKSKNPTLKSHCYDIICRLDSLHRALGHQVVDAMGRAIYGTPLVRGPFQIRIDDKSNDRILPMHQELEQISLLTLNIWLPLVPISEGSGGLRVIPGSHKRGPVPHLPPSGDINYASLPPESWDGSPTIDLEMNAGDALLFHPFLFHASLPNRKDRVRWVAVARFNELGTMPYLRDPDAPLTMKRNPQPDDPGAGFMPRMAMPS